MIDLKEYGYCGDGQQYPDKVIPGRITEIQRELYTLVCAYGEVTAVLKGSFYFEAELRGDYPAVGDFVLLQYNESGHSRIESILPRKSKFSRTDFSGHGEKYAKTALEQVVATNFDYVFIVSSLNKDFNTKRISRYISAAYQSGGLPVVILTKADLCENAGEYITAIESIAPALPVLALSSLTGEGLETLQAYLQPGKTIVFLGMSGVGKSSLVNALAGENIMAVKAIREEDARGRHTTTHRELIRLPSGAMIIDTPGMRELGLWDADAGISTAFSAIEELISQCRFSDCGHISEPGCAVLAALEDGSLSPAQWKNYLAQKREAAFMEDKSAYLRESSARDRAISKAVRGWKKGGGKFT